jgi:phosphoenolpyruvate-protein kinase (PTS system EI component)
MKSEPTMTDVLNNADQAATHIAEVTRQLEVSAGVDDAPALSPAPFVYQTETQEVARNFISQIERLSRLLAEDDDEIAFLDKERDRTMHEAQLRFEEEQDAILNNHRQASEIVMARRADRANARGAVQKVVDNLQQNGTAV